MSKSSHVPLSLSKLSLVNPELSQISIKGNKISWKNSSCHWIAYHPDAIKLPSTCCSNTTKNFNNQCTNSVSVDWSINIKHLPSQSVVVLSIYDKSTGSSSGFLIYKFRIYAFQGPYKFLKLPIDCQITQEQTPTIPYDCDPCRSSGGYRGYHFGFAGNESFNNGYGLYNVPLYQQCNLGIISKCNPSTVIQPLTSQSQCINSNVCLRLTVTGNVINWFIQGINVFTKFLNVSLYSSLYASISIVPSTEIFSTSSPQDSENLDNSSDIKTSERVDKGSIKISKFSICTNSF